MQSNPLKKLIPWFSSSKKWIYFFEEGSAHDREACKDYQKQEYSEELSHSLASQLFESVSRLEKLTNSSFATTHSKSVASHELPLLLSVRSGAAVSMPGMMDTILNLGINDELVDEMSQKTNNPRWAFDTYRRFLQMFGDVVLHLDKQRYEDILSRHRTRAGVQFDCDLPEQSLREIVDEFKKFTPFPHDPHEQLRMAVVAVFNSWNSSRAVKYRDINNIPSDLGTAVIIQAMVYGNYNERSGAGVCFTRNPQTGVKEIYGDYLPKSEGEDVVSGARNPFKLVELKDFMPEVFKHILDVETTLEKHYRDVQDIEFLVQNNRLFILQTRKAKRSALAAVKIAVDMVEERLITEREAIMRLESLQMDYFLHPMIDESSENLRDNLIGEGQAASAGAATGLVTFSSGEATKLNSEGKECILCREETSADDIAGMKASVGVLTVTGGITSHAAVVMRGMGRPAVTGAKDIKIDVHKGQIITKDGTTLQTGDIISIDGTNGKIYKGEVPKKSVGQSEAFRTVMEWADKYRSLQVMANADTVEEIKKALEFGADGIGLCRTELMFFKPDRLNLMRRMIISESEKDRYESLEKILPLQQHDFYEILSVMDGLPTTIRLLDPPVHEFLPNPGKPEFEEEVFKLSGMIGYSAEYCQSRIQQMQEKNPMLGLRGCRLSIVHKDILDMQMRAIIGGALQTRAEGKPVRLDIMIPLVFSDHEIDCLTPRMMSIAKEMCAEEMCHPEDIGLQFGAMIETPRACIRADKIAKAQHMSFISFGSNDLTQLTFGLSRDDTAQFMPLYINNHIVAHDPFQSLDLHAVGPLIHLATKRSRDANPSIKIGLCGEHGADLRSIYFLEHNEVHYTSCTPFRIPSAKVAAAQAHIETLNREREKESELKRLVMMHSFI